MNNSKIPVETPPHNAFDLSHDRKLTHKFAELTPILCEEVVAGDKFHVSSQFLLRCMPILRPIFHRVEVTLHYFFVPMRLLWNNPNNRDDSYESFATGGPMGNLAPAMPTIRAKYQTMKDSGLMKPGSLLDHLGMPPLRDEYPLGTNFDVFLSALPFRAYQLIYNEYYRDQTLQPYENPDEINGVPGPIDIPLAGGTLYADDGTPESLNGVKSLMTKRYRSWKKDYFTSALPFAQRGEEVTLALATSAPIQRVGAEKDFVYSSLTGSFAGAGLNVNTLTPPTANGDETNLVGFDQANNGSAGILLNTAGFIANLGLASSVTINQLRAAAVLQQFYEKMARGGARYIEYLKNVYGTSPTDERLQRPEYLGGSKNNIQISDILNKTAGSENAPLGEYGGHGVAYSENGNWTHFFPEPGYVIGLINVMPEPNYMDGMRRQFMRRNRLDFLIPQFAHLGEQSVHNGELFYQWDHSMSESTSDGFNLDTFGYQERFAEYRCIPSSTHGDFRTPGLADWHLTRMFDNLPELGASFITIDESLQRRIFAVQDGSDYFLTQMWHEITANRPLPVFGVPGINKI